MSDMDPALITRLEDVGEGLLGRKLRVAGQVLAYDAYTGLALLRDRDVAVVVDVALCVSAWGSSWVGEHLCTVTAVGYLERAPDGLGVPGLPKHFPGPAPQMDGRVMLRALLVNGRAELDMDLWNAVAIENNGQ